MRPNRYFLADPSKIAETVAGSPNRWFVVASAPFTEEARKSLAMTGTRIRKQEYRQFSPASQGRDGAWECRVQTVRGKGADEVRLYLRWVEVASQT